MTKDDVKKTALEISEESGLINLTRKELSAALGIHDAAWGQYFDFRFSEIIEELAASPGQPVVPVTRNRAHRSLRKNQIIKVGLDLYKDKAYHKITRSEIAKAACVSEALITKYYGTMKQFKRDLMRAAISQDIPEVVAQGLANGDQHARKAPEKLKAKAARYIANI